MDALKLILQVGLLGIALMGVIEALRDKDFWFGSVATLLSATITLIVAAFWR